MYGRSGRILTDDCGYEAASGTLCLPERVERIDSMKYMHH